MIKYDIEALDYIAKIADGGMRDAITLMDKCLSYSLDLTLENVLKALGIADYDTMLRLNTAVMNKSKTVVIEIISEVYNSGVDLKLFIKTYFEFILDLNIFAISGSLSNTKIPETYLDEIDGYGQYEWDMCLDLLEFVTDLQSTIKWEQNPKSVIIAKLFIFMEG